MAKKLSLDVGGTRREVELSQGAGGAFSLRLAGSVHTVDLQPVDEGSLFTLIVDGKPTDVAIVRAPHGLTVAVGADSHHVQIHRTGSVDGGDHEAVDGELRLLAPMSGAVVEVLVAPGDHVAKGDPLLVMVAMKMNNEIRAPAAAIVKAVPVAVDDAVEQGGLLVLLQVGED